ncbi:MAG: TrmJ/YjtD family RNA methyltransferase [Moraxella sp.]|uniref:RNA methyltransferase n=1 Tax=Moraxella sp. TaxID=479 RepID=UPI0026DBFB76|nr:TrmJ/YjtD family RNA methyltransferase [Moraxella sp.]MDO4449859.1 TrmJ/YjtD family RNA methyltransferase [Moraxella sp.]
MTSLMTNTLLDRIHTIMVNTTLPANIGSTARAMHTMGLSHLTVVSPRLPIDDSSYANAAGGDSVLNHTTIAPTIETALAPHSLIFMASARSRHLPKPVITPHDCAVLVHDFLNKNPDATIALVFGREDRGLTNDELAMADYHVQIPANPTYPVLNVASSVQVIASTIYAYFDTHHSPIRTKNDYNQHNIKHHLDIHYRIDWDEPAITHAQKTQLDDAIITMLTKLNLAHDDNLKDLPKRLSRLSSRLQLDQKEYALLRALMAKIYQKI